MATDITNLRSAFVQAQYNGRMAKILAYEIAYVSIAGALAFAFWLGWQWFFWSIILIPIIICIGLYIPIISDLILTIFGMMWGLPFFVLGVLGIHAFYLAAVVAFLLSFWVHGKAFSWYVDLDRTD